MFTRRSFLQTASATFALTVRILPIPITVLH